MFDALRKLFGGKPAAPSRPLPPPDQEEEREPVVPEITVEELRAALSAGQRPLLLDVREAYEWRQGHLAEGEGWELRHLPMNAIPGALDDLPRGREIVVVCAHGSRSYGVAHYLNEQGFAARSLSGGVTRWAATGGSLVR